MGAGGCRLAGRPRCERGHDQGVAGALPAGERKLERCRRGRGATRARAPRGRREGGVGGEVEPQERPAEPAGRDLVQGKVEGALPCLDRAARGVAFGDREAAAVKITPARLVGAALAPRQPPHPGDEPGIGVAGEEGGGQPLEPALRLRLRPGLPVEGDEVLGA
jgi:hypothetical protein